MAVAVGLALVLGGYAAARWMISPDPIKEDVTTPAGLRHGTAWIVPKRHNPINADPPLEWDTVRGSWQYAANAGEATGVNYDGYRAQRIRETVHRGYHNRWLPRDIAVTSDNIDLIARQNDQVIPFRGSRFP